MSYRLDHIDNFNFSGFGGFDNVEFQDLSAFGASLPAAATVDRFGMGSFTPNSAQTFGQGRPPRCVDTPAKGVTMGAMPQSIALEVNGRVHTVRVDPGTPLLYVLRNDLGLTAAKFGCGLEQCGACTVIVDGAAVLSCREPADSFVGRRITTLEGIGTPDNLHPLQRAFIEEQAAQCGYCIPGIIMAAKALLDHSASPADTEIRAALAAHLCRCGTHARIVKAVKRAAQVPAASFPAKGN